MSGLLNSCHAPRVTHAALTEVMCCPVASCASNLLLSRSVHGDGRHVAYACLQPCQMRANSTQPQSVSQSGTRVVVGMQAATNCLQPTARILPHAIFAHERHVRLAVGPASI
jgi:hypothetical protein